MGHPHLIAVDGRRSAAIPTHGRRHGSGGSKAFSGERTEAFEDRRRHSSGIWGLRRGRSIIRHIVGSRLAKANIVQRGGIAIHHLAGQSQGKTITFNVIVHFSGPSGRVELGAASLECAASRRVPTGMPMVWCRTGTRSSYDLLSAEGWTTGRSASAGRAAGERAANIHIGRTAGNGRWARITGNSIGRAATRTARPRDRTRLHGWRHDAGVAGPTGGSQRLGECRHGHQASQRSRESEFHSCHVSVRLRSIGN